MDWKQNRQRKSSQHCQRSFGSWDYGWLTFSPPVSVFCNVVILLYNEKHIYFYGMECPGVRLQANSRHKETLLHCQRQGLDTPTEGTFTPGRAGNFGEQTLYPGRPG